MSAIVGLTNWKLLMQTGDLVKHNSGKYIGIVYKTTKMALGDGVLHHIRWNDGSQGSHWSSEIEVINASR